MSSQIFPGKTAKNVIIVRSKICSPRCSVYYDLAAHVYLGRNCKFCRTLEKYFLFCNLPFLDNLELKNQIQKFLQFENFMKTEQLTSTFLEEIACFYLSAFLLIFQENFDFGSKIIKNCNLFQKILRTTAQTVNIISKFARPNNIIPCILNKNTFPIDFCITYPFFSMWVQESVQN